MKRKFYAALACVLALTVLVLPGAMAQGIALPVSLQIIETEAFLGDNSIEKLTLPEGVLRIENRAFANSSISAVKLPKSLIYIADDAFEGCGDISVTFAGINGYQRGWAMDHGYYEMETANPEYMEYTIENNQVRITGYGDLDNLVAIPETIEGSPVTSVNLRYENLAYNKRIQHLILPRSLTSIEDTAFQDCDQLVSVYIPDTVVSIGDYAFEYCSSMTSIVLPDSIKTIGSDAFFCSGLTDITIPEGVTTLKDFALRSCKGLTEICLPESVVNIGSYAFQYCTALEQIRLPSSLAEISKGMFASCSSLQQIRLPDGVTAIGNHAFSNCSDLREINIPDGVTSIGDSAFRFCYDLKEITIPKSVAALGSEVFYDCSSITVRCYENSATHTYCEQNHIPYELIAES